MCQHATTSNPSNEALWVAMPDACEVPSIRLGASMTDHSYEIIDTADIGLMGLIQRRGEQRGLLLGVVQSLTPQGCTLAFADDVSRLFDADEEVVLCLGFGGPAHEKEVGFVNVRRATTPKGTETRVEIDFPRDENEMPRGMLAKFVSELLSA